jgi:2-dehydro-3-deoxygluconokinase
MREHTGAVGAGQSHVNHQLDVITTGELLGVLSPWDLRAPLETSHLLVKGIGGTEVNVALGLARLGHRIGWCGAIGDDPVGREGVRLLRSEGIDVSRVRMDSSKRTGLYLKESLPLVGTRCHMYRDGSAAAQTTSVHR